MYLNILFLFQALFRFLKKSNRCAVSLSHHLVAQGSLGPPYNIFPTPHNMSHAQWAGLPSCLSSSSGVTDLLLIPSVSLPLYCLVSDGIKSKLDFMLIGIRITGLYRLYLKVYLSSNIEPKHSMVNSNSNCVKRCPKFS